MVKKTKVFLKKFDGHNPSKWASIGFTDRGDAVNLLKEAKNVDECWIVLMVKEAGRDKNLRGRIIGVAKFDEIVGDTKDYVSEDSVNEIGTWVHGIPMTEVWEFDEPPKYKKFFHKNRERYNKKHGRKRHATLTDEDAKKVLSLPRKKVPIYDYERSDTTTPEALDDETRAIRKKRARSRGRTPYTDRGHKVSGKPDGPHDTYIFRFESRDIWKIGFSSNTSERLEGVNTYIPYEFLDEAWIFHASFKHDNAKKAHKMEQDMLDLCEKECEVCGEFVKCSEEGIMRLWEQVKKEYE